MTETSNEKREILVPEWQADEYDAAEAVPEKVWDPLQPAAPKTHVLEVARAHGVEMSITLRPWTARQRMVYEDTSPTLLVELEGQFDKDGDQLVQMKLGALKVLGAALTIIGSSGFALIDGRPFLTGTLDQKRADLLSIADIALFHEITEAALAFEPLPGSTADKQRLAEQRGEVKGDDPSQTPPTQPTAAPATDIPASPTE